VEEGTKLDATVSGALLYSVFIPSYENPTHDGAVVIRKNRLAQAGAFLPLTANPKLEKTLGTRHRAAIGITEETDAVVVVVSEERGTISLCFNGNIARSLDAVTLKSALEGLRRTGPNPTREGFVQTMETKMSGYDSGYLPPPTFGPRNRSGPLLVGVSACCNNGQWYSPQPGWRASF